MLLCADVGSADADLASGAIACPSCGGRLGPWGHGRERAVRLHYGERAVVRPPRGRCRACRATHMLLPSWMAPRRADGAGVIARAANLRLEEMFGYEHGELTGRPVELLVPAGLQAAHRGHRAAYARAPRARPMGAGTRLVALRKDGTSFPAEISLSPVATATGTFTLTVIRDVTEARKLADLARAAVAARQAHDGQELLDSAPPACTTSGSACRPPRTCPTTRPARASPKRSGTWTTRSARSATPHSPPAARKTHPAPRNDAG